MALPHVNATLRKLKLQSLSDSRCEAMFCIDTELGTQRRCNGQLDYKALDTALGVIVTISNPSLPRSWRDCLLPILANRVLCTEHSHPGQASVLERRWIGILDGDTTSSPSVPTDQLVAVSPGQSQPSDWTGLDPGRDRSLRIGLSAILLNNFDSTMTNHIEMLREFNANDDVIEIFARQMYELYDISMDLLELLRHPIVPRISTEQSRRSSDGGVEDSETSANSPGEAQVTISAAPSLSEASPETTEPLQPNQIITDISHSPTRAIPPSPITPEDEVEDTCGICLDSLHSPSLIDRPSVFPDQDLANHRVSCAQCNKEVHAGCMNQWIDEQFNSGYPVRCPFW